MKISIFFVACLLPFAIFGQAVKKPTPTPTPTPPPPIPALSTSVYSLLDIKSLQKIETQDLSMLDNYNSTSKGIVTGFKPLLNNWYYKRHLNGYTLIKLKDNKWITLSQMTPEYRNSRDETTIKANLNDTILVLSDGKMLDISKDSFVESNYFSSRVLTADYDFSLSRDRERICKSDFIGIGQLEEFPRKSFDFHLLGDKESFFIWESIYSGDYPLGVKKADNPDSKYILTSKKLINRYNMNESINLEYLSLFSTFESQVMTYTDSLVYISFPIGEFSKFLNFEFNKQINIPLAKDFKLNEDNLYLKTKVRIPDQEEFIGYCYQMKKYNNYKINIETLDQDLFQNSYNGFKNVFYDIDRNGHNNYLAMPYVILAYNFRTNTIESIIDRNFLPFYTISEMLLDKRNRFLVIQSGDYFTIYDVVLKKELYNIRGIVNHIDKNNNLVFNTYFIKDEKYGSGDSRFMGNFSYRISEKKIKLDELYTIDKVAPPITSLKFDEFTSKENFMIACENNRMALNTSTFTLKSNAILPPKTFSYSYSIDDIKKKYEAKISLTEKLSQYDAPDINWIVKYNTYDLNNEDGLLTLKSDPIKFETLKILDKNDKSPYLGLNARKDNPRYNFKEQMGGEEKYSIGENIKYHPTTLLLEEDPTNPEYFIINLKITRVSMDEAKLIKESQQPISINLRRVIYTDMPNYSYNIFLSNYYDQIQSHWVIQPFSKTDFKSYFNNKLINIAGFFNIYNQANLNLNGRSEIIISIKQRPN
jgi:hypothetical protein